MSEKLQRLLFSCSSQMIEWVKYTNLHVHLKETVGRQSTSKCHHFNNKLGAFWGHVATQQTYMRFCAWYEERQCTSCRSFRHLKGEMCKVSSVVCSKHLKPDYFAWRLDFKGEEGILLTSWLKRGKFGISVLTLIHAAIVASDLRNSSSQSAQLWQYMYLHSAKL